MQVEFQMLFNQETETHQLGVRVKTLNNDMEIFHTKVVTLSKDLISSVVTLMMPCAIEFEDVEGISNDKAINTVKEQEAAKAAADATAESAKSDEEVVDVQSDSIAAPESF